MGYGNRAHGNCISQYTLYSISELMAEGQCSVLGKLVEGLYSAVWKTELQLCNLLSRVSVF